MARSLTAADLAVASLGERTIVLRNVRRRSSTAMTPERSTAYAPAATILDDTRRKSGRRSRGRGGAGHSPSVPHEIAGSVISVKVAPADPSDLQPTPLREERNAGDQHRDVANEDQRAAHSGTPLEHERDQTAAIAADRRPDRAHCRVRDLPGASAMHLETVGGHDRANSTIPMTSCPRRREAQNTGSGSVPSR